MDFDKQTKAIKQLEAKIVDLESQLKVSNIIDATLYI